MGMFLILVGLLLGFFQNPAGMENVMVGIDSDGYTYAVL